MATFTNKATLSYNGKTTDSNTVTGTITETLTFAKNAVEQSYTEGDRLTYVISLINSGTTPFTGLSMTDDLGAYPFGTELRYPLTYVDGSLAYYIDGVLQATPTVSSTEPLIIEGITVPASGNTILVYTATVNPFAPLGEDAAVFNTATVTGGRLSAPLTDTETVSANGEVALRITKALSPDTVVENGTLTYTFTIENDSPTPAVATDDVILSDTFDPILEPLTVTFNGTPWTEGVNYTYDTATGAFATMPGQLPVPAATYAQDPVTGEWITTPGVAVLTVTGTV